MTEHILRTIWVYSESNPLLFTRFAFWIFLTVVLAGYAIVYRNFTLRHLWLFLASIFFYYKSGGFFFILLLISIVTDYTAGIRIAATNRKSVKHLWVWISLLVNLGLLGYFKYTGLFVEWLNHLPGINITASNWLAGYSNKLLHTHFDINNILLPVGISFYTFQTISYTLDVYRGKTEPVRRFTDFAFYVSFFPQLVAGPIVRAAQFIPQLKQKFRLSKDEFGHALFLILTGLFKKMVIADMLARTIVDKVFDQPSAYTALENLFAWYGYGLQIFSDFSGYTDIAIGVALLFGFRIPVNFNAPYKAVSLTDFWRRWHISLSSWLRDYLYIPLGGNRKGSVRSWINIMITMLLGGLWHGASIRFLIWGGLHGAGLVLEKIFFRIVPSLRTSRRKGRWFFRILVFHWVTFLWLFFRAGDMQTVRAMIYSVANNWNPLTIPEILKYYAGVIALLFIGYFFHWLSAQWQENLRGWFLKTPIWLKFFVAIVFVILLFQIKDTGFRPFIYFRF